MATDDRLPALDPVRLRRKIGNLARYRTRIGAAAMGQAQQRTLEVEAGAFLYLADDFCIFCQWLKQANQARPGEKGDLCTAFRQQPDVARELDGVAEALFAENQNVAARQIFPLPQWRVDI